MTPFNINGKTIFISDITKILFMTDEEFDEEYRDLIAQNLGDELDNPFSNLADGEEFEPENDDKKDYPEIKDFINKKMT